MSVSRNEPCPCGSGKKYKKCCMQKQNVIQMHEVIEERFRQQKHNLVKKLEAFVDNNIPYQQRVRLEAEFNQRSNYQIDPNVKHSVFRFWLYFFYICENGLRTIEWFYNESQSADLQMIKTWVELEPKLVQAVEWKEDVVIFEDMLTKERYQVSAHSENISTPIPWYGTLGLLELFNDTYYFNGVKIFVGPTQLSQVATKIKDLCKHTKLSHKKVMMSYYPELLGELLSAPNITGERQEKELTQYKAHYQIENNEKEVISYLSEQFEVDHHKPNDHQFSWVGEWQVYEDSELVQPIRLGKVYGMITLKNRKLTFESLLRDRVSEFQSLLEKNVVVKLINVEETTMKIPFHAEVLNMVVSMDKSVPPYFSVYAQNCVLTDVDAPIPMYDHHSLRSLMETGQEHVANVWLKQSEYDLYKTVYRQMGEVDVTADFNTVRKQLNLPLSPFVAGGISRSSSIKKINTLVQEEDIPFLEELGFTPTSVNSFFAKDFLKFYKEKTVGKSDSTVRKYRSSLYDLRYLFEQSSVTSWEECSPTFWDELISVRYVQIYETMSKTQVKDLFSTLKAFAKWLNERYETDPGKNIVTAIQRKEPDDLLAVGASHS
ncbi:SEC-C domain-containing protein [Alkalihalobacillus sp. BA299]|uniref:SEC-C domain-containing protein n=1 Tax=Alkalihalobacillus sp. BA299 TaxID=2815938 RepID=UPI001AD99410|nr:SEC-C domain-containing protein [Alkalihalobacillus sp. BA299]